MLLQADYFIEPVNAWLPSASAQKFSHMLLARHLGADWRRIFRRDPDQVPDDPDQAIAMIIDVSAKLAFSGDMGLLGKFQFLGRDTEAARKHREIQHARQQPAETNQLGFAGEAHPHVAAH